MRVLACILIAVALVLRLTALLDQTFSLDEGYSALFSRIPLTSILINAGLDSNPPLGNVFFHLWCGFVQYDPFLVRIPGVVASVLTLGVLWRLLQPLLPSQALLFVLLFKTVSLYDILYARQLRVYPFAELALVLAWLSLAHLISTRSWRAIVCWGAFSALACHLHYFCALVVAATCAFALIAFRERFSAVLRGVVVLGVLAAPLGVPLWQQFFSHRSFNWIAPPGVGTLLVAAYQLCGHSLSVLAISLVLLFSATIIRAPATGITGIRAHPALASACLAVILIVVGLAATLSYMGASFFHPRYFFFLQVPFITLLSLGLAPLSRRLGCMIATTIAAIALIPSLNYLSEAPSYLRAAQILERAAPSLSPNTLLVHRTKCSFSVGQLYDRFQHQHRLLEGGGESNMFNFPGLGKIFISQVEAQASEHARFVTISEGCES